MTTTPHLVKPTTQVNTTDGGTAQSGAEITPLQDGGYVVVWTDQSRTYNTAGSAIVGQRYDSAGNKVGGDPAHGGEVMLSQFLSSGDQFSPAVTTLANGNIAVAFVDLFSGDHDIYVRIFDPTLHEVRRDAIDLGTSQTVDPSLTALADGSYVVSYTVEGKVTQGFCPQRCGGAGRERHWCRGRRVRS
jgi:large repetitive protein